MDSFPDTGWKDHRLPGLMKEAPERQAREPEGSGEGKGTEENALRLWLRVCVGGYRLFTARLSALVGTPILTGSLRQKPQADEVCLYLFWLLFFGGM